VSKKRIPPISPLEQMMGMEGDNAFSIDDLINTTKNEETKTETQKKSTDSAMKKVNPKRILNWRYHDRPENELGDIEALAKEFNDPNIGQQQPCIVRPYVGKDNYDYELIAGERRWRAALKAEVKLLIIVKELTDEQAELCQIAENLNRENLSEYATGKSLARLLEAKTLKQKDLQRYFPKFTAVRINRLLSFSQVPNDIWDAVGDMRNVTSRTATEIRSLLKKGDEYKLAIIQLAQLIQEGKVGSTTLVREVEKLVNPTQSTKTKDALEVRESSGRHLFSWRKDSNKNISISFPKDIRERLNKDRIQDALKAEITKQLKEFNSKNIRTDISEEK
jgi:ParB family chromosome partitioning protein